MFQQAASSQGPQQSSEGWITDWELGGIFAKVNDEELSPRVKSDDEERLIYTQAQLVEWYFADRPPCKSGRWHARDYQL